jgi:hypothetical protein
MMLDFAASRVIIAGRSFPGCGLICPQPEDRLETDAERLLGNDWYRGGKDHQFHLLVFVPMENGALAAVGGAYPTRAGDPTYDLMLFHPSCERSDDQPDWMWMPVDMELAHGSGTLRPHRFVRRRLAGIAIWTQADEDWLAEFIPRLAHRRVDPPFPPGPPARLIRLDEMAVLNRVSA